MLSSLQPRFKEYAVELGWPLVPNVIILEATGIVVRTREDAMSEVATVESAEGGDWLCVKHLRKADTRRGSLNLSLGSTFKRCIGPG